MMKKQLKQKKIFATVTVTAIVTATVIVTAVVKKIKVALMASVLALQ